METIDSIISTKFSYEEHDTILRKFLLYEFCFLSGSSSYNYSNISKEIYISFTEMQNYFQYPMILTKCLILALQKSKKDKVNVDEYVKGFMNLYTGNFEKKIKFIFSMFNINRDNYIHYEDVKCILNYAHIYNNKYKLDLLNSIINSFFHKKISYNRKEFIDNSYSKNSDLFFVILSTLFEKKTFSLELLSLLNGEVVKSETKNQNEGCTLSKFSSKEINRVQLTKFPTNEYSKFFGQSKTKNEGKMFLQNFSSLTMTGGACKLPKKNCIEYIQTNYNMIISNNNSNLSNLNISKSFSNTLLLPNVKDNLKYKTTIITSNSIPSCDTKDQEQKDDDLIDQNMEDDENLMELNDFEKDYKTFKHKLKNLSKYISKNNLPKYGNVDYDLKDGVFGSNKKKEISKFDDNKKKIKSNETFKKSASNENIIQVNVIYTMDAANGLSRNKKFDLLKNNSFKEEKNNNLNLFHSETSFSDFHHSNSIIKMDIEEEIYLINKQKDTIKKFTCHLNKGFNFIVVSYPQTFTIEGLNDSTPLKIKYLIPLKNLYIQSINESFLFNEEEFIQIKLVSTILLTNVQYKLYFDKSKIQSFEQFKKFIIKQTNYTRVQDEYTIVKDISRTSNSMLKLVRSIKTNCPFSLKKVRKCYKSEEEYTSINWEKDISIFLTNYQSCDNILKHFKVIETLDHIYYVDEYIKKGTLFDYIISANSCLPSSKVFEIANQVCNGLKELHNFGIIHRDLKIENLLIDYSEDLNKFRVKITDFGLSQVVTPLAMTNEQYGTIYYSCPEIFLNEDYNNKIDIWSLGIICFYLEYTFMPFGIKGNEKEEDIRSKVVFNEIDFPSNNEKEKEMDGNEVKYGKFVHDIINQCLMKDKDKRPSADELFFIIKKCQ